MLPQTDESIPLPPLIKSKRISSNSSLTVVTEISYISFAEMANPCEINAEDLLELAQQKGLIADNNITDKGKLAGLKSVRDKRENLAFPQSITQWEEWKI